MPTDAERYNLLLQALATGIEDIRQAFEVAFGVVLPSAATLNEELERIARAIYEAADRPRPAPVIDDKPTTRTHFVYRIDIWTNDGKNILEHLAGVENLIVARAAYRIACERWPNARITLRQSARVVEDSRRRDVPLCCSLSTCYRAPANSPRCLRCQLGVGRGGDSVPEVGELEVAARAMGIEIKTFNANTLSEVYSAFTDIADLRPDALLIVTSRSE